MASRNWSIRWIAALTPDQAMVPGNEVFAVTAQKCSLTATIGDTPGLLLSGRDLWRENIFAIQTIEVPQIIITEQSEISHTTHLR